jgi:hypothetical protein
MAKKEGGGKGCLKWGCIGCAGLLVLVLLLMALFSGVAWQKAKSQEIKDDVLTYELPVAPPGDEGDEPGNAAPEDAGAEGEATGELRQETLEVPRSGTGRVVLDMSNAGFFIRAGRPGEPLKVKARYDAKMYELIESFEQGDDGWIYHLQFRRTGSMLMALVAPIFGGEQPELRVFLPPDVLLDLEMDLNQAGSEVDLGGLWLNNASVDFHQGGFQMAVSEPLREPMEQLTIRGAMGGFNVEKLGNASPHELEIDFRMGGMFLDLRGAWAGDADIDLTWTMGGAAVYLPQNAALEGIEGHTGAAADGEVPPPTLRFRLSGKMDDIEFLSSDR